MFKISVATRVISLAILITLLFASFATTGALAKGNNQGLENKWEQLVDSYNRQSMTHNSAHHWAEAWLKDNPDASASKKAEVQKHLTICNSALATATTIVSKHNGFDASGKVVDKAAARQSAKDLTLALQRHASSIRNLDAHVNK
jgi:hypothetical protein